MAQTIKQHILYKKRNVSVKQVKAVCVSRKISVNTFLLISDITQMLYVIMIIVLLYMIMIDSRGTVYCPGRGFVRDFTFTKHAFSTACICIKTRSSKEISRILCWGYLHLTNINKLVIICHLKTLLYGEL